MWQIIIIPFLGTTLGAASVFLFKNTLGIKMQKALSGFASGLLIPTMPYLLSFAAGAMIYVVVEELIPEMSEGEHSNIGTVSFALGFILMMALDVGLG